MTRKEILHLSPIDIRIIRAALKAVIIPERTRLLRQPQASEQAGRALERLAELYCETTDKPL